MRIVPSCTLGSLTLSEAEPVFYTWRWYHSATGLGLWLVLILAMALPRGNRTPKTLLILVPLAAVVFGWFLFQKGMGGNLSDNAVFGVMVYCLAVGSAVLWLLAHRFPTGAWYKTLSTALGVALGVALVGGLSLGVESNEMLAAMAFVALAMVATTLGYALAARGYRTRRAWRFLVFQAAGTVIASFVGVFLMLSVLMLVLPDGPGSIGEFVQAAVAVGLVAGFIVFLIALPFGILGLTSPFFRQRLIVCLSRRAPAEVQTG